MTEHLEVRHGAAPRPRASVDRNDPRARQRIAKQKARERAQMWRDARRDAGVPDNAFLGRAMLTYILEVDAKLRWAGKPSLEHAFKKLIERLPPRFDKEATAALIKRYRDAAVDEVADREFLAR